MALSKAFKQSRRPLLLDKEEVATVRGVTSTDLSLILAVIGSNIDGLFKAWEAMDRDTLAVEDNDALADQIMDRGPAIMMAIATNMPVVINTIIAVACMEDGDDMDINDAVETVSQWPLPLQVEALRLIARATFTSPEGFRVFVGNILALVESVRALTSAEKISTRVDPPSSDVG